MEKEYLIKKWLDNDLTSEELEAFKSLDDYESLLKLSAYTKRFRPDQPSPEEALIELERKIEFKKSKQRDWYKPFLKIAAVIAICFGIYHYSIGLDSNFSTDLAEKIAFNLPDGSSVDLNAVSQVTFNKNTWDKKREVTLSGEAFFKVAKGSRFNVVTKTGTVSVLGTQFNVKQRKNYFEVSCYEGLVQVVHSAGTAKLSPGQLFTVIDGKVIEERIHKAKQPDWMTHTSTFKSVPLRAVLAELERYYSIKVTVTNIDLEQLFTGKFTHSNLSVALQSIAQPLGATLTKSHNSSIILKRE